jgi:hypothetical protein
MKGAKLRSKALQAVLSIFQSNEKVTAVPFILAVGPELISLVVAAKTAVPKTDADALFLIDAMKFMEFSASFAEPEQRIRLLTLLIPAFVALLYDSNQGPCNTVYTYALAAITKIGPLYADDFRRIMTAAPQVKASLENAIRARAARDAAAKSGGRSAAVAPAAPTIQLKMDFSAFK